MRKPCKWWELAAPLYGEGTTAARTWTQEQGERIEQGQAGLVLAALAALTETQPKARAQ